METTSSDVEASTELATAFMANRPSLAAFVRAHLGSRSGGLDIEDAMQDLWLRCTEARPAEIADVRSYLFRMAHNLVLNWIRSESRARKREAEWVDLHDLGQGAGAAPTAERALLARERVAMINERLEQVGTRAARIFRRYRLDGVDQRQIAREFGVSLSTVEKDLRRAYEAVLTLAERYDEV